MTFRHIINAQGLPGVEFEVSGQLYRSYPPYTVPWVATVTRRGRFTSPVVHERGLHSVGEIAKSVRAHLKALVESGQIEAQP